MKRIETGTQNIAAESCGRRIELTQVRVAVIDKIPVKNRMRRTWLTLEQLAREAKWPGLSVKVEEGEFLRVHAELTPGESATQFFEGAHYRFFYSGQAETKNNQSYFSHNSFAFNGIRPELKRKVGLRGGAPRISRANHLLFRERRGVAWWLTALKSVSSPRAIFIGAESARVFPTSITIVKTKGGHWIDVYQGLQCEYVQLNRKFTLDPILIQITDSIHETMEEYGTRVGQAHEARVAQPASRGWSSWYKYYPRISEEIILKETAAAKANTPGFSLLQIDDGYQSLVGDWTAKPEKFPSGLQVLAAKIRAEGMKPGIWLSPFMADKRSRLACEKANPDWFLHSFKGRKLTYRIPRHSTNYILDVTHPEVELWLRSTIRNYREWGYEYLKIDFLMLQSAQARRHDPSVTGLEAYRRGLEIIREEAGDQMHILLSGSIDLAGVGLADANRTGPDIAYDILGGNTRLAFIKAAMCATAAHAFMGHRWFTPNADAVMIRQPLKDSLVEMMLAQAAMTGGDFVVSDDFAAINKERLKKLNHPFLLELNALKGSLRPLDYFDHVSPLKVPPNPLMVAALYHPPRVWLWRSREKEVLFLYNFAGSLQALTFQLESTALSTRARDIFHGDELTIEGGRFLIELPPESVRIFPLN